MAIEHAQYHVKDYMSDRRLAIKKSATFKEAVATMIQEKTNGLVVIDDNDKVVGIVSSLDLIRCVVPDYLEDQDRLAGFEAEATFPGLIKQLAETPVESFMTKNVHAAKPQDTLMGVAAMMCKHGIRQIPITDENDQWIGYINRTDIKRAISDALELD